MTFKDLTQKDALLSFNFVKIDQNFFNVSIRENLGFVEPGGAEGLQMPVCYKNNPETLHQHHQPVAVELQRGLERVRELTDQCRRYNEQPADQYQ